MSEALTAVPTYCPHGPLGGVPTELRDGSDCRWDYGGRSRAGEYLETHLRVVHRGVDPRPGAVQLRPKVKRAIVVREVRPVEESQVPEAAHTAGDNGSGTVEEPAGTGASVEATDATGVAPDVDGPGSTLSEPGVLDSPRGDGGSSAAPGSLSVDSSRPRSRVERGIEPWTDDEIDNAFRYFRDQHGRWPLPCDAKTTDYLPARTNNKRGNYQAVWRRLGAGDIPVGRAASVYMKSGKPAAAAPPTAESVASAGAALIAAARTFLDTLERQLAA